MPIGGSPLKGCDHTAVISEMTGLKDTMGTISNLEKKRGPTGPSIFNSDIWSQSGYRAADPRALTYQNR